MASSLSAKKRIRQNAKAKARNRWRMTNMKTAIKAFMAKTAHGSIEEATAAFKECAAVIDRTAAKGVIHKNQAARRKSRLSARLKAKKAAKA